MMETAKTIVRKYGGSSVSTPEKITAIAQEVAELHRQGHNIILVVSAMGKSTDQLHGLARQIAKVPHPRELDMLISTGERVTMALMSMALHEQGIKAISFTGSQAGLLTDEAHLNAHIMDIKPFRLQQVLNDRKVVVVAGFQGVSPVTKEITTLGRGGTDTSAVAMAACFHAASCDILKDVEGIFSADPHRIQGAQHYAHLEYKHLLDMTFWGSKILHYRSVELATILNVPLKIALAHGQGRSTVINGEQTMYEQGRVLSVNSKADIHHLQIPANTMGAALETLGTFLSEKSLPWPQLLHAEPHLNEWSLWWTTSSEAAQDLNRLLKSTTFESDPETYAAITLTCQGLMNSPLVQKYTEALENKKIKLVKVLFGAMGMTFIVPSQSHDEALSSATSLLS